MSGHHPGSDRVMTLLADRAVQGLPEAEVRELDRLLAGEGAGIDAESMDLAAAAGYLALAGAQDGVAVVERMPASVRARIEAGAMSRLRGDEAVRAPGRQAGLDAPAPLPLRIPPPRAVARGRDAASPEPTVRRTPWVLAYGGWAAAAALLIVAASAWLQVGRMGSTGPVAEVVPAELRDRLLAEAGGGVVQISWVNPADQSPQPGDVVWHNERQEGYMRLSSLPANDPAVEQYQLWIIDPTQEHPIDGGVFDVPCSDEVVVPVRAKLRVSRPAAFAVTVEKPGGVVVSDRKRLPLLAMVGE